MITVNIITKGAELGIEQPTIADGTAGGMVAKFCTDSLWHGLALTAVFRTAVGDILMPLKNNECEVPFEATENCGEVLVGLFGTDGYRTLTSVFAKLNIAPGTPTSGDTAKNYTPSLYEQFAARFERVENMTATAEKGEDAEVIRSDVNGNVNFHFVLPKGDQGEKGDKGDRGEKGDTGQTGKDGYTPIKGIDYFDGKDAINNVYYVHYDTVNGWVEGDKNDELIEKIQNNEPCEVYCVYTEHEQTNTFLLTDVKCAEYTLCFLGTFRNYESEVVVAEVYVDTITVMVERLVALTDGQNPCLVEGTPINMADGSTKAIEDVKSGDIVQSYNPVTKELTPAIVVKSYVTGHSRDFIAYNFSNGSHLTIYGLHGFYNSKSGAPKDIQKITRDDRLITLDGEEIQWAGSREMRYSGAKKRRYNIVTSNNLYFANGILLGSRAPTKLQFALDRHIALPEEIRTAWQKDCDDYNAYESFIDTPEFYREVAEDQQELAKAQNIIRVNKKRLADSDYKVQKYTEGLIDDAEWQKSKDKRAIWRKQINDSEEALKLHKAKVDAAIQKRRGSLTPRSLFEACCARDNALFDACKEYFAKGRD